MVLPQAMAAGKPVTARPASGVRLALDGGRNGRLLSELASTAHPGLRRLPISGRADGNSGSPLIFKHFAADRIGEFKT